MKQHAFDKFGFKTLFQGVYKYPELLFKSASQPAERVYSTESLEDTVFPVLLWTVWKAEV